MQADGEEKLDMEIRDPIHGSIAFSDSEKAVIDSRAFQRLREIKQLGFGEFSFPGGMHNRYVHSIGAFHLAGEAFDSIFKDFSWSSDKVRDKFRQVTKLAALLHDIGHGPLSHTTEIVMPDYKDLKVPVKLGHEDRQATHEDYTIKVLLDSHLTQIIESQFQNLKPIHIASLVCSELKTHDDFFREDGLNFKPILSQLISSELDVDRMDYLVRDAYYCGTNYGKIESAWILSNLSYHKKDSRMHLSLDRRALYAFEDFLLARHHMYLMVYFHHKSIIYDEMLREYFKSDECTFTLPADIEKYLECTDQTLYHDLRNSQNEFAQSIARRNPYVLVLEKHSDKSGTRKTEDLKNKLSEEKDLRCIYIASQTKVSKYQHKITSDVNNPEIFIKDKYHPEEGTTLAEASQIFDKYREQRGLARIYVHPEDEKIAKSLIQTDRTASIS